jgi:hypothetical protein
VPAVYVVVDCSWSWSYRIGLTQYVIVACSPCNKTRSSPVAAPIPPPKTVGGGLAAEAQSGAAARHRMKARRRTDGFVTAHTSKGQVA